MAAVRDGKPAEAEPMLDEAIKEATADYNTYRLRLALAYRTMALVHQGRSAEARTDFAELEYLRPPTPFQASFSHRTFWRSLWHTRSPKRSWI